MFPRVSKVLLGNNNENLNSPLKKGRWQMKTVWIGILMTMLLVPLVGCHLYHQGHGYRYGYDKHRYRHHGRDHHDDHRRHGDHRRGGDRHDD